MAYKQVDRTHQQNQRSQLYTATNATETGTRGTNLNENQVWSKHENKQINKQTNTYTHKHTSHAYVNTADTEHDNEETTNGNHIYTHGCYNVKQRTDTSWANDNRQHNE